MHGYAQEFLSIVLIIIALSISSITMFYFLYSRTSSVEKFSELRYFEKTSSNLLLSLAGEKLNFLEKRPLEIAIDSILQEHLVKTGKKKVFYGIAIGLVNCTEIIPPFLDREFGSHWSLEIYLEKEKVVYGHKPQGDSFYVYEMLIPVPEEKIGKVVLKVWR